MESDSDGLTDATKWSMPETFPPVPAGFGTSAGTVIKLQDLTHQQLLDRAANSNQQNGIPEDPFNAVLHGIPERAQLRPGSKEPESHYMGLQGLRPHGKYAKAWRKVLRGAKQAAAGKAAPAKVGILLNCNSFYKATWCPGCPCLGAQLTGHAHPCIHPFQPQPTWFFQRRSHSITHSQHVYHKATACTRPVSMNSLPCQLVCMIGLRPSKVASISPGKHGCTVLCTGLKLSDCVSADMHACRGHDCLIASAACQGWCSSRGRRGKGQGCRALRQGIRQPPQSVDTAAAAARVAKRAAALAQHPGGIPGAACGCAIAGTRCTCAGHAAASHSGTCSCSNVACMWHKEKMLCW